MANVNDIYPSKFLKLYDLKGTTPTVTIARVTIEPVGRKQELKAVLYFAGKIKGLVCNKTMALIMTGIAKSAQTEAWTGVTITLYATTTTFAKQTYDVIGIKAPAPVKTGVNPQPRPTVNRASMPPIFTDELEIDLQDAGDGR